MINHISECSKEGQTEFKIRYEADPLGIVQEIEIRAYY